MRKIKVKLSDLEKVPGIGKKTIERIRETLGKPKEENNFAYKSSFDLPLNNFYVGQCAEWMRNNMPSNFVDLTVTSPPYDNLRQYQGFSFGFEEIAKELYRITKPGGVVIWIVGDATIGGSETGTSFRQALYFRDVCGFNLHDTMIYAKTSFAKPFPNRYHQVFEYMFVFCKNNLATFNPIADRENKNAGKSTKHSSWRENNGSLTSRKGTTLKKMGKRFNIWTYLIGNNHSTKDKIAFKHPASFPEKLAEDHILSWSNPGDLIFDPFVGSGTTAKMACLNDRKFIGVDMSEEYINDICVPRLEEYGWERKQT